MSRRCLEAIEVAGHELVQCTKKATHVKAEKDTDRQHWGKTRAGKDVVWMQVTLPPPQRKGE